MSDGYQFRPATQQDAHDIARLVEIASDGVAVVEWAEQADESGCTPIEIGERLYQSSEGNYAWTNCTVVEKNGNTAGILLNFAQPETDTRNSEKRPGPDDSNVLAPYMYLEEPDSWYVCAVAVFPQHRGKGLGTRLMQIAETQATHAGFSKLSLVVFEQNTGAVNLYQRLGYHIVDQAPVIPHPLIQHSGLALLMVKEI